MVQSATGATQAHGLEEELAYHKRIVERLVFENQYLNEVLRRSSRDLYYRAMQTLAELRRQRGESQDS